MSCPAGCPRSCSSPGSSSRSSATICHSIARPRSSGGRGSTLDRGTLGNWVGRACFHLMPVIDHMRAHLRGADRIFVDETRAPVLDPGRKAHEERILLGRRRRRSRPWRRRPAHRAVPLRPRPGQGASAEVPRRIPRPVPAMRRLPVLRRADRDRARRRPVAAGLLLDACPPPLREALRERGLTHRRGDAAADRAALSGREDRARQGGRPCAWLPGANMRRPSSPRSSPGSRPSSRASRRNPSWPRTSATPWRTGPA